MKMGKPTTEQRRAFILSMRDSGLSYEQIAAEAIKKFGKENLPRGYNKRLACLDMKREFDTKSSNKLNIALRNDKIFHHRLAGMTYQQILNKLREEFGEQNLPQGYTERHVCRDLKRYLKKIDSENKEELIETRNLYRQRLNFLLQVLWHPASQGDLPTIDRTLKIMETLFKISGLESVSRTTISPAEKELFSFADQSEYFSNLNRKGNGNGNNDQ